VDYVISQNGARSAVEQVRIEMNRGRGRLFEVIELAGLAPKQEDAFKGLVRKTTYDLQASLEAILRKEG
jgi:hypothetical protein